MGRRSRHSAKTGDRSIYKSREESSHPDRDDDSDDDPMYDAAERHHNRKEEEQYLRLGGDSDATSSEEEDDGITKHREGVFDLGTGGSSDDDESDDDGDEESEGEARRAEERRAAAPEDALVSSDDADDDSDSEGDDGEGGESSRLLNWGDKKHAYYHGDTADLEIGQDVEDAYLEEEAGREVEKARYEEMDDADFMLDGDEEEGEEGDEPPTSSTSKKKKNKKRPRGENDTETIQSIQRSKRLSKLSKKERIKFLRTNHPELLPLVQHFSGPIHDLSETTMVAAGALLKGGVVKGVQEAEAVGATTAGLRYLLTKCMLQASKALNVSLYLLLKADQASKRNNKDDDDLWRMNDQDEGDDLRNHPVMDRLNQLSKLTDALREGVEDKVPGLNEQMASLVKAAALMAGGDLSSTDDDSEEDGTDDEKEEEGNVTESSEAGVDSPLESREPEASEESSSESEDDAETQEAIQRRILTEAKFGLRRQDVDRDAATNDRKRKRRVAPATLDYGDDTAEVTERALSAGHNLASTMNSIEQKSSSKKKKKSMGDEEEGDDEYEDLQRGLAMMEDEFGKMSDEDGDGDEDAEGLHDSDDGDDFYRSIKSKSKARKEAKKQMYAVAPKYPRLEGEVAGERAIGRTIMKNRGLVAHKAKINRNPRVKKREQYRKALIRRKGAVRDIRTDEGDAYGGEATGVKSGISRSRKL